MNEGYEAENPFLDDDDELDEISRTAGNSDASVAPATTSRRVNPYAPLRTAAEQAEVDQRKANGEVSDGTKKNRANPVYRRKTATAKDMALLVQLARFRLSTSAQLSQVLTVDDPKHANYGQLLQPKSVDHRLRGLEELGLVESRLTFGGGVLWALTSKGIATADLAYNFKPGQVHKITGFKQTETAHALGVHQVAAQLLSPYSYSLRKALGITGPLTHDQLITEHEVKHHWYNRKQMLIEEYAEVDAERKVSFGQWRESSMLLDLRKELKNGLDWDLVTELYPEMWTIGLQKHYGQFDVRDHHHPDLVVNLEATRKGARPVSLAVEVEMHAKTITTYKDHLETWWQCEFDGGGIRKDNSGNEYTAEARWKTTPAVYARLVYFTNDQAAVRNLRVADRNYGLEKAGRLIILPLLERDDLTPMKLTSGW